MDKSEKKRRLENVRDELVRVAKCCSAFGVVHSTVAKNCGIAYLTLNSIKKADRLTVPSEENINKIQKIIDEYRKQARKIEADLRSIEVPTISETVKSN